MEHLNRFLVFFVYLELLTLVDAVTNTFLFRDTLTAMIDRCVHGTSADDVTALTGSGVRSNRAARLPTVGSIDAQYCFHVCRTD